MTHEKPWYAALGAALIVGTGTASALADEVVLEPAPSRRSVMMEESVPNRGIIVSGVVLLGATYTASAIVAASSSYSPDNLLYVPIVGPWMDLADRKAGCGRISAPSCNRETTYDVLLVADGVAQGIGTLQIVGGLLFPATRVSSSTEARKPPTTTVALTPRLVPGHFGLVAHGTF